MLPTNYYNGPDNGQYGDSSFLIEWIDKLPIKLQKTISERYSEGYIQLEKEDPHQCRYRMNCWLRATVKKHQPKGVDLIPF